VVTHLDLSDSFIRPPCALARVREWSSELIRLFGMPPSLPGSGSGSGSDSPPLPSSLFVCDRMGWMAPVPMRTTKLSLTFHHTYFLHTHDR